MKNIHLLPQEEPNQEAMIDLKKEAEEYAEELIYSRAINEYDKDWMVAVYEYIATQSNYVQAEKLKAQIEELEFIMKYVDTSYYLKIENRIDKYQQQLNQLENDNTTTTSS
jgi:hypothetical protein